MLLKGLYLVMTVATVYGNDLLDKARELRTCGRFEERKCNDDKAAVYYTLTNPGKCLTKECLLKPSTGYTEHPDRNPYVKFFPQKFSQKIIYTFDEIKAKTCGFQNQPCTCKQGDKCTCDNDRLKICKQKYRYERSYFLVINTAKQAITLTKPVVSHSTQQKPYHHQQYYNQQQAQMNSQPNSYSSYNNPAPSYNNPAPSNTNNKQGNNYDEWYSTRTGELPNYYPKPNMPRPQNVGGSSILNHLMMQKFMGGSKSGGNSGMMKWLLMSQMMNKQGTGQQQQQQVGYDTGNTAQNHASHTPGPNTQHKSNGRQKAAKHGTVFSPTMLYYMMKRNNKDSGSSGSKFLQMLPMLMGNNNLFGGQLELKSLWVQVPYDCKCEHREEQEYDDDEDDDDSIFSLIPYLLGGGGNPMTALMGGGGNSMAALMGGGGNPMAALMGGGGNPMAALMGGSGLGGNPLNVYSMLMNQNNNNDYGSPRSNSLPFLPY
ncbi:uncharacterized protein LOC120334190 [Styela clava]